MTGEPRVWVLTNGHPGNTTQAVGLAERLGWPYTTKELSFSALDNMLPYVLLKAPPVALRRGSRALLTPPWPDLAIGVGRSVIPVMRWIGKQSAGRTRLVQLGRTGSVVPDLFDMAVVPAHCPHRSHERILEILTPINRVLQDHLVRAGQNMPPQLADVAYPRVVLLVGGQTAHHRLDDRVARRMGTDVRQWAEEAGGGACAVTSRRTDASVISALQSSLGQARVHVWGPNHPSNRYLAFLAQADILIVTSDSESMVAEAVATSKPVYIYQLPVQDRRVTSRIKDKVFQWAWLEPVEMRNRIVARAISFFCKRVADSGLIGVPRSLSQMHGRLRQRGIVRFFGEPLTGERRAPFDEGQRVATYVKRLVEDRRQHVNANGMLDGKSQSHTDDGARATSTGS